MRQRVRPLGDLATTGVPGRFDVMQIENGLAAVWSELLQVRRAPEVLHHAEIVVFQKLRDAGAEAAEAIDQRRRLAQQAVSVPEQAGGGAFGVAGGTDRGCASAS